MVDVEVGPSARVKSVNYSLMDLLEEDFRSARFFCLVTLLVIVYRVDKDILVALHQRRDVLSPDGCHKDVSFVLLDLFIAVVVLVHVVKVFIIIFHPEVNLPARPLRFVLTKVVLFYIRTAVLQKIRGFG